MYLNRVGSSSSAALRSHHITWTSERRWAIPATFMHQECSGMLKPAEAARVVGKLHFWFARKRVRFWRNSGSVHTSPCLLTDVWKRRSEEWWMQREEAKRVSVWFFPDLVKIKTVNGYEWSPLVCCFPLLLLMFCLWMSYICIFYFLLSFSTSAI